MGSALARHWGEHSVQPQCELFTFLDGFFGTLFFQRFFRFLFGFFFLIHAFGHGGFLVVGVTAIMPDLRQHGNIPNRIKLLGQVLQ